MYLINTFSEDKQKQEKAIELVNLAIGAIPFDKVILKLKKTKNEINYSGRAYTCLPYRDIYKNLRKDYNKLVTVNLNRNAQLPTDNIHGKWIRHSTNIPQNLSLLKELKANHAGAREHVISAGSNGVTYCNYVYCDGFPYGGKDSIRIEYHSLEELLVGVTAHEACHIYQFQNNLNTSEAQCEWFAASQLELFRNNEFEKMKKSLPFDV